MTVFLLWIFLVGSFAVRWPGGIRLFTTTLSSASMEPTIYSGSLIITKAQLPDGYNPGDIVSFYVPPIIRSQTDIVTHRIVSKGGNVYLTKGDANSSLDPYILIPRYIIGKVIFVIPLIGNVIGFAKTNSGMYVTVIIPAAIFAFIELKRIRSLLF